MASAGDRGGAGPNPTHPRMSAGLPHGGTSQSGRTQGQRMPETASEIGGRVGDAWESARHSLERGARAVADRACSFWTDASNLIRRRPMAAIGIAFGIGCIVGCCLTMAVRSSSDDIAERMSRASA